MALCAAPAPPTAGFTSNFQNICEGSDVQFFDQSTGIVNSRVWSFSGGTPASSTVANPIVNYPNAGSYPVSLTVTNTVGSNTETLSGYITVGPGGTNILLYDAFEDGLSNWTVENPNGNITWTSTGVGGTNLGGNAVFMDNWNLNGIGQRDGLVSQPMNFTGFTNVNLSLDYAYALYSGNTNFKDSLIIKLSTDGGNTYPNTLFEGGDNGNGNFATTAPQGQFNPTSTPDWCYGGSYGAGCISLDLSSFINQSNVVIKFENVNGYGNNLFLDNITVSSDCEVILPPVTDFTASQTLGCVPMTVNFTDLSTNGPTSWSWSFPGGIPATSSAQNPTVLYNTPGVYDVSLVSSNSAGSNSSFQSGYITVEDVPTSSFDFTVSGTFAVFNNMSTGGGTYTWLFGDGNTSNEVDPVHNYGTDGEYEVTLIVSNNCGVNTSTQTVIIVTQPIAGFNATPTTGCGPLTVQFNDSSSPNTTGWNWNFPGGTPSSSTEQNPMVIYNNPGIYSVDLTASNSTGTNTFSQTNYITVNDVPSANFTQAINGLTVDFTNGSTNANSYSWDFGDGNSSAEINPTHTYASDGTYTVILTATNDCGSVSSTQQVTISTLPTAGFNSNVTSGCVALVVQFNDMSSSNTTSWLWTFPGGDPSSSTEQNPIVTYNSAGSYSVILVASNSSGDNAFTLNNYITVDDVPSVGFTESTNGQTVTFTNTSSNAVSYNWDFGDGNSSADTNPTHTYANDGTYTVILTATNNCGSVISQQTITVSTQPTAGFGANVTSGCADLTVQFSNQSSANTTNWNWSFPGGNPSSSTDENPIVVYENAGSYTVTLEVSNAAGTNTSTITNYIIVDDVPLAGFTQFTDGPVATFTNTSTNAISYSWDFGDGNTSTETNPIHTYANDGTYTVVLTATNNCGTVTTTQTVVISNAPSAGFGVNVTSGCADLTVQFMDQSSSNTTGWNWSFPGGNPSSSNDQNPTVVYENAGVYSVTLEATNSVGNSTITQTDYIIVDDVPAASFSQVVNGLNVDFTNTSTNGNSYNWDFGDGNTSTDFSPNHTYAMDGTYDVILSATNSCGTVTTMTTVTIITAPTAGFGANVTSGCADLTVQFSDQSSANTTSWNWSFVGGNPSSSTEQNPTVVYENAGTYTVTLTVTNAAGNNMVEQTNYIVVDDVPFVGFTANANAYNVDFTNTSTNANSYSWDFGDGNTSTEANPSHTYTNDGMYDVVLTATNNCGSVTFTQTITIANTPTANWTSGPSSGCTPFTVQFQDQSSSNTTSWEWTFDGGTPATSSAQNPSVVYNNSGTYSVTLVAINNQGTDTITLSNYVVVDSAPSPDFSSTVNGPLVNFTNQTTNATSYSWDFGDGAMSTEVNPEHQYSLNGEYTVILTATNDCGTTTTTQTVSITSSVIAGFSSSIVSGCLPLEVQFTNESTNATSFEWTFTGGMPGNSNLENPLVTYENAGVYTVMLTATNATGSSTVVETGFIVVEGVPFASFSADIDDLTIDFTNFSSSGDTFLWNFGDGNTSTEANPQHTYSSIGIYTVTLTATNDCGSNIFTTDLDVGTTVSAGFFAEDTQGCAPLQVQFIDESSNNVNEWSWTFPGGNPSTSIEQNPLVNYTTPGTYEVTLVASNPFNSNTVTETNYITILPEPTASFTSNENGNVVDFNNTSTNADTYLWMFGDGETSIEENPSHTYVNDGTYTITLEATNTCGTVTIQETITILTPVSPGFTADVTSGCAGLEVQFSDASSSNVTGWNWTFAGGTPSVSTEQNPIVTYNTPGTYSVVLEVNNSGFNATQTEMNFIVIVENPTASFTSVTMGGTVDFTNTSTNATSYLWDFGDGETSTEENPSHSYASDGNYIVTLTATNACGSVVSEINVNIALPPVANFSLENTFDCAPATIQFINESSPNATQWFWTFDGGSPNTATVQNPAITFNTPGTHTVTLTASNTAGSSMFSIEITLGAAPVIDFSSSVNELTTTFTNQTINGTTFFWDFGDGNSSIEENPIYTYDEPGNYTVILTATNVCGTTTLSQQVEVMGAQPVAGFNSSAINGCLPFTVTYEDTSTGNPTNWNWSFPGGTPSTSTEQNPTVVYNSAGTFDVNLEVTNPAGTSTIEQTNYITVGENPIADFTATVNMNGNVDFTNNSNFGDSYEWIFGDGNTSIENSPNYTYDTSGLYTIQLIVTNNCGTDTMTQEIFIDVTGVEDVTFLEKFDLYPNPNNGDFTLHIEGQPLDMLQVSLFNVLGQQIFQEQVDFSSGQLIKDYELSRLAAATYILQIKSENQMIHRKVVKK